MTRVEIPSFASEAEEAQWWFDNQDALDDEFLAAAAEGRVSHGTLAKRFGLTSNLVCLDPQDAQLARELALKHGQDYELYVQNLVHEALLRNAKASETVEAPAAIAA